MDLTYPCLCFPLGIQLVTVQQLIANRGGKSSVTYAMGTVAIDEQVGIVVVARSAEVKLLGAKLQGFFQDDLG